MSEIGEDVGTGQLHRPVLDPYAGDHGTYLGFEEIDLRGIKPHPGIHIAGNYQQRQVFYVYRGVDKRIRHEALVELHRRIHACLVTAAYQAGRHHFVDIDPFRIEEQVGSDAALAHQGALHSRDRAAHVEVARPAAHAEGVEHYALVVEIRMQRRKPRTERKFSRRHHSRVGLDMARQGPVAQIPDHGRIQRDVYVRSGEITVAPREITDRTYRAATAPVAYAAASRPAVPARLHPSLGRGRYSGTAHSVAGVAELEEYHVALGRHRHPRNGGTAALGLDYAGRIMDIPDARDDIPSGIEIEAVEVQLDTETVRLGFQAHEGVEGGEIR